MLYSSALLVLLKSVKGFHLQSSEDTILFLLSFIASIIIGFMIINAGKGRHIEFSDAIIGFLMLNLGVETTTVFSAINSIINGIISERAVVYQSDKSKKYFNTAMFTVIAYVVGTIARQLLRYISFSQKYFMFSLAYSVIFIGLYLIFNALIVKIEYTLSTGKNFKFSSESIKLLIINFVVSSMLTATLYIINETSGILGSILVAGDLIILHYCFFIYRKLQVRNEAIKALIDITGNIVKYGDFRDKCKHLIITLKDLIPYNICAMYTFEIEDDDITYPIVYNGPKDIDIGELSIDLSNEGTTLKTVKEGKIYISRDIKRDRKINITGRLAEYCSAMIFVPIKSGDKIVGLMMLGGGQDLIEFSNNEVYDIFNILSNQMALAIENDSFYNNIKNKADRDYLTKLFNRRVLERELDILLKTKTPFSLVIYDIDDFKVTNDTYGHLAGDEVLKMISEVILKSIRKTDVPCRFGGEEIVIIFKDLSKEDAYIISERIRQNIETTPVHIGSESIYITVSGGVSSYPDDGDTKDKIIGAADNILYSECKRKGKNRVCAVSVRGSKNTLMSHA
ncbi:diguanylate cyclase with GAF sensor [Fonticella tunisiensis]|uniref:Diguanylate cyclase with GAF sensor n=2 Tax=Fonticella tunisiensis TaxID=1096341 RepID=A0A4R7KWT7_9CLOT|nr:diguanylate cyclase with GAF sensor [Fonticella tunisiensis]